MIKVWGRMTSTNVQKVMWCIDELAVAHEHIDIPHGRAKEEPAYLAMNPNGLVPTIEEDGFVLWESNACVRYIAAKFGAGRYGRPICASAPTPSAGWIGSSPRFQLRAGRSSWASC
jgi:glutathione S-transferase